MEELYLNMSDDVCEMISILEQCLYDCDGFFAELSAEGAENLNKFEEDNPIFMMAYAHLREIRGTLGALDKMLSPLADKEQERQDAIDPN